jgi:aldose 1-epimerase
VLEGEHAATAYCVQSGIKVDIFCDLPGLQFYSGNFLNGCGKSRFYSPRDGFALEPQYFPNAINTQQFEKPILKANQKKHHYIRYEFTVK